jgi:hypothetical protein
LARANGFMGKQWHGAAEVLCGKSTILFQFFSMATEVSTRGSLGVEIFGGIKYLDDSVCSCASDGHRRRYSVSVA